MKRHSTDPSSSPQKEAVEGEECERSESPSNFGGVILEQDRFLPIANVARCMKKALPSEGKLSKEAKECMQECVTEFLLFITSESSDRCSMEKRKTITGDDLIVAFQTLGFDDYLEPLGEFLRKYREANKQLYNLKADELPSADLGGVRSPAAAAGPSKMEAYSPSTSTSTKQTRPSAQSTASTQGPTQLQQIPMWHDNNGQYYITVNGPDGIPSLLPVNLTTTGVLPEGISFMAAPSQAGEEDEEEESEQHQEAVPPPPPTTYLRCPKGVKARKLQEL